MFVSTSSLQTTKSFIHRCVVLHSNSITCPLLLSFIRSHHCVRHRWYCHGRTRNSGIAESKVSYPNINDSFYMNACEGFWGLSGGWGSNLWLDIKYFVHYSDLIWIYHEWGRWLENFGSKSRYTLEERGRSSPFHSRNIACLKLTCFAYIFFRRLMYNGKRFCGCWQSNLWIYLHTTVLTEQKVWAATYLNPPMKKKLWISMAGWSGGWVTK